MPMHKPTLDASESLQAAEDWFVYQRRADFHGEDGNINEVPIPDPVAPVPAERYQQYADLPHAIHRLWQTFGFTGDFIDPVEWEPIVAPWLDGLTFTHMPNDDHFVPLTRSETGNISLLGTRTLNFLKISPQTGRIQAWNNAPNLRADYFRGLPSALSVSHSLDLDERSTIGHLGGDSIDSLDIVEFLGPVDRGQFYGQRVPQCEGGPLPRERSDLAIWPISEIARYGTFPYKTVHEHHARPRDPDYYEKWGYPAPKFEYTLPDTPPLTPVQVQPASEGEGR